MLEVFIVLLTVALDQWTKYLTDLHLVPLGTSYPFWENVVHFTSAHNTGAAFGFLAGGRWLFLIITPIACGAIVFALFKMRGKLHLLMRICLALILGGAIGNFIDRVFLGYVRDMIELRFMQFAIFNVADSAVSVGAVLLMLDIFFGKGKRFFEDPPKPAAVAAAQETEVPCKETAVSHEETVLPSDEAAPSSEMPASSKAQEASVHGE